MKKDTHTSEAGLNWRKFGRNFNFNLQRIFKRTFRLNTFIIYHYLLFISLNLRGICTHYTNSMNHSVLSNGIQFLNEQLFTKTRWFSFKQLAQVIPEQNLPVMSKTDYYSDILSWPQICVHCRRFCFILFRKSVGKISLLLSFLFEEWNRESYCRLPNHWAGCWKMPEVFSRMSFMWKSLGYIGKIFRIRKIAKCFCTLT